MLNYHKLLSLQVQLGHPSLKNTEKERQNDFAVIYHIVPQMRRIHEAPCNVLWHCAAWGKAPNSVQAEALLKLNHAETHHASRMSGCRRTENPKKACFNNVEIVSARALQ